MHYKAAFIKNALDTDNEILNATLPYKCYQQIMPVENELIYVGEVIKRPVLDKHDKIIGVVGCGRDITHYVDPLKLFDIYQEYYPRKDAIRKFLGSIGLLHAFYQLPTRLELIILLAMRKTSNAKYIAQELNLSARTIEHNKANLSDNLKVMSLNEFLIHLRLRHEIRHLDSIDD